MERVPGKIWLAAALSLFVLPQAAQAYCGGDNAEARSGTGAECGTQFNPSATEWAGDRPLPATGFLTYINGPARAGKWVASPGKQPRRIRNPWTIGVYR
jgi:hypothetical protein